MDGVESVPRLEHAQHWDISSNSAFINLSALFHTANSNEGGFTLGSFSSSRFILAYLAMITSEHGAVDLSLLLSNGLMGLTQSVVRLAGT